MNRALLPCPFCGGDDVHMMNDQEYGCAPMQLVGCKCGARGPRNYTNDGACAAWNRRPTNPHAPPLAPL